MQPTLLYILMGLGCLAKSAAIWRAFSTHLIRRHALFCAMAAMTLARSLLFVHGLHPYQEFWLATRWPMAILEAAAALEAFWRVAEHFRGIRGFGFALLGIIALVAAAAAAAVGTLRTYWSSPLRGALLLNQYTYLGLLLITLLSLAFFRQFSAVPIRPNAARNLLVLAILFGSSFAGNFVGQASRGESRFLPNLLITAGAILGYGWWAIRLSPQGERLPFPPQPPLSKDDFAASELAAEQAARAISRASSKALSKALRPW